MHIQSYINLEKYAHFITLDFFLIPILETKHVFKFEEILLR
jgi:hypothetical protein